MEKMKTVCRSPWCKATFFYTENDMTIVEEKKDEEVQKSPPSTCPKCKSFDTELSGGIEWKDKEYEGSRFDGMPHQMKYKVTNYKL